MIRKQIYLTPELDRELTIVANRQGKSVAEVVRETLSRSLNIQRRKNEPAGAVLLRLAANAWEGPSDLSTNLFGYLYGEKSRKYGKRKKNTHRR